MPYLHVYIQLMLLEIRKNIWKYTSQVLASFKLPNLPTSIEILIDFSLIVKAATLILISGRGSAISSAKEGKSGVIYNLIRVNKLFWAVQTCVHFMKILTVYTLNSHLFTLKAHNHKIYIFVVH